MKLRHIILSGLAMVAGLTASAQEQPGDKVVNEFVPHWYIQGQFGGQYTLGEISFSKLLAPNAQVGVGYEFNPVFGLRLSANGWQSKGGWDLEANNKTYKWHYFYVAPMLDLKFNLSNLFCGYNPNRVFNVSALVGGGVNIAWHNDNAQRVNDEIMAVTKVPAANYAGQNLEYLWDGTKVRGVGRAGLAADFRVSDRVSLGFEATANVTTDAYNSKKAGNADWYFNALAGIKINLGKTNRTKTIPAPKPQERIIERIVEKPAPAPVEKKLDNPKRVEALVRDIFFSIREVDVPESQQEKVREIAAYLNENPNAKVTVSGYADAGTGSKAINAKYAKERSESVAKMLTDNYGVSASRIVIKSYGDTVQPYKDNDRNRVVVAVAE
ncbi:MAG: OmpA family protein [Prevotella sp.]|nr:OmpA family protein [Prevotella sp.]